MLGSLPTQTQLLYAGLADYTAVMLGSLPTQTQLLDARLAVHTCWLLAPLFTQEDCSDLRDEEICEKFVETPRVVAQ